jgi:tetratricopeptide (TPR) repeat protein
MAFSFAGMATLSMGAEIAVTPTLPPVPAVTHITDAQDRMGTGKLRPAAEDRSHANALYAEAMLLPEDLAGDQQTALGLFRQIVALDPSFTEAQIKLANLFLQTGQTDQALSVIQTAAAAHPDSIPIQVALGYTLRLHGDNDEAVRLCTRALIRDPSQTAAMRVLLEVASDQNDLAGGVLHIEDILKAKASEVTSAVWLSFARLYLEVARGEQFPPSGDVILRTRLPILQEAAAVPPPDVETLTLLAANYRDLGRKIEALSTLQRATALEPSNTDLVLQSAGLEAELGETTDAIKDYEKAYDLNPGLPGLSEVLGDLYLKLAIFQLEHNQLKAAGATLATAQARFPQSAWVCFYQAIQHRYEKNYDAALASLAEVRALASGTDAGVLDPGYYLESALVLNLAGKKAQLESVLQEGLAKYPDNPELMNELAYFWADSGQHLAEALDLSRRATVLDPSNGPILDTYGWVYFQMGQAKDALPYLQRAAIMTNNDPVVLQHVGDAYLKLGLRHEAIATWSRALEKDPRNGDLANRIDAAQAQAKNAQQRSAPRP